MSARFCGPGEPYHGVIANGKWNREFTLHPDKLVEPIRWRKPRMVFVNSMSDLFYEKIPVHFIDQVFGVMMASVGHTFQVLTKRPEVMKIYMDNWSRNRMMESCQGLPPKVGLARIQDWPPKNVWLGVSAESQEYALKRIPVLLATKAVKRFVSVEPILGEVQLTPIIADNPNPLHWVIAGCESGPKRRKAKNDWFRSLRDECDYYHVDYFLKQMDVDGKVVQEPYLDGRQHLAMPITLAMGSPAESGDRGQALSASEVR